MHIHEHIWADDEVLSLLHVLHHACCISAWACSAALWMRCNETRSAADFHLPVAVKLSECLVCLGKLILPAAFVCQKSVRLDGRQVQQHGTTRPIVADLCINLNASMHCVTDYACMQVERMSEGTPTLGSHCASQVFV